jgi:hypothetical protein
MEDGIATISSMSAEERQAAIRRQLAQVDLSTKDKDTAFLLELIGGVLGFLGVGYLYSGLTNAGLVRLVAGWIFWALFWIFAAATLGLGTCLVPVPLLIMVAAAYFSATDLKTSMESVQGMAGGGGSAGYIPETSATRNPMDDLEADLNPDMGSVRRPTESPMDDLEADLNRDMGAPPRPTENPLDDEDERL